MDVPVELQTKKCNVCGRTQRLTVFRRARRGSDQRQTFCNSCHALRERERRRRKRDGEVHAVNQQLNRLLYTRKQQRLVEFLNELLRRYGGPSGFAQLWKEAIDRARDDRKHYLVIRAFWMVAQLSVLSDRLRAELDRQIDHMDQDECDEELGALMLGWVSSNADIAAAVLRRDGWRVESPTSSEPAMG